MSEQPEQHMLDERFGLAEVISENLEKFPDPKKGRSFEEGFLYCATCGGRRRVRATTVYSHARDRLGGFSFYRTSDSHEECSKIS